MVTKWLIRFNTQFKNDPEGRLWRVLELETNTERLFRHVDINVNATTVSLPITTGELKHHILAEGRLIERDGYSAIICSP